jgi:hypothetical protein
LPLSKAVSSLAFTPLVAGCDAEASVGYGLLPVACAAVVEKAASPAGVFAVCERPLSGPTMLPKGWWEVGSMSEIDDKEKN